MVEIDTLKEYKLRYTTDQISGFTRKLIGKHFQYFDTNRVKITDEKVISRINKLTIPPAWEKVWICLYSNGHLQATGYDKRKRKQYRYHERWNEMRQNEKFTDLLEFADALPRIRKTVAEHRNLQGLPRENAGDDEVAFLLCYSLSYL